MKNLAQLIREGHSLAEAHRMLHAPKAPVEPVEPAQELEEGAEAKPRPSRKKKPESEPSGL